MLREQLKNKKIIITFIPIVFVTLAGCSLDSSSDTTSAGPSIGVNALGANASAYVTQIRAYAIAEGHVPQNTAELKTALGGVSLPNGSLVTTYSVSPDGMNFCFISKSVGTVSVYDSSKNGEQPVGTLTCSPGMQQIS